MQGIFGRAFGQADQRSLTESDEISEAPRPMPSRHADKRGALAQQSKKDLPVRGGKSGLTIGQRKALKAKAAEGDKKFHRDMKHTRGEMDKSHNKSTEKGATTAPSTHGATGGRDQNPFKNAKTIGVGPESGRKRSETRCWSCHCKKGTYAEGGCQCTASGSGKNCPPAGTKKMIKIDKAYHQAYNTKHHKCTNKAGVKVDCKSHGG
jgi:hypothetical protein